MSINYNVLLGCNTLDDVLRLFEVSDMPFGVLCHMRELVDNALLESAAEVGEPRSTYDDYTRCAVEALGEDFGWLTARFVGEVARAKGRKTYLREAVEQYQREFENVEPDGEVLELLQPLVDKMVSEVEQAFNL